MWIEQVKTAGDICNEQTIKHLQQLKAQVGKLKMKQVEDNADIAYNNAIYSCVSAIDKKIEKIKKL